MELEIEKVRPPVISHDVGKRLRVYLEFRHRFRNIYGFELEWEKMKGLKDALSSVAKDFKNDVMRFLRFMEELSKL